MDSAAREPPFMARERDTNESRCLMALLPPETKIQIMSYIGTQQSLSRLAQSCGAWYGPATQELYTRDAKEHRSFAIKWMAAHAVDEQTTDSALRTLETSRRWGGQIDAVKLRLPRSDDDYYSSQDQMLDGDLYGVTTALHFAVFLGNSRLTKMLLDMKASLIIPCSNLLWRSMGSEQFLRRFGYFVKVLEQRHIGPAFPIFMAFLHSDADMCKLLIEHGAGREAIIFDPDTEPKVISILHLAAADPTTDYRQWQCLFDRFREYIDEPCPRESQSTPLHIALESGCIQGMQIAVEYGADKESKDGASHTPLSSAIRVRRPYHSIADRTRFDEHLRCLGKFVDLGGSVNPDGDSLIGTFAPKTNMVKEIIDGIYSYHNDPSSIELFKGLLSDLVDGGLNLAIPAPGLPSPLYRVLHDCNAKPEWLFDFLCENGATIHEREVDSAFLCWCKTWRLWETNKYDAWWQHQGQEDEMFLKWCEDPYNAWWWQHVKQISPLAVSRAYGYAVTRRQQLYDILTHLPLAAPLGDVLIKIASASSQLWSWRLVVLHEFEEDFLATWSSMCGDNMIHLTVNAFVLAGYRPPDYSAADAMQDILHLRDKGVDMNSRNFNGQTPLEVLLDSGKPSDGLMEVAALLEGKVQKVQELA
ncbi:uncharacterized protein CPUR_05683 [Claviceps purpurea 20.1]|uniref:F-box domain-containing protein n=1 Tax=Claviceps purpurea (strain 20.1) TaxID=1111077 RepID=M1WCU5_CLAP2|nr:uncharacterized protein CPUR_05683 [Claviceps purpurea 20.1]